MKEEKRVELKLKKHGITQYKITRTVSKSLSYLYNKGKTRVQKSYEDKIYVKLLFEEKEGEFGISSFQSDRAIESIIGESIKNAHDFDGSWSEEHVIPKKIETKEKITFEQYNEKIYIDWLEHIISTLKKQTNENLALYYKIELSKYSMSLYPESIDEFINRTQCTCIIGKRKIDLVDCGLFHDIAGEISDQLRGLMLPYKELNPNTLFLIKGKAVSQFLDKYILMYYGSYIYEGYSFIKPNDFGVRLVEKSIDMSVIPYKNIYFDGEGSFIQKKDIINGGKLITCLCNSLYSRFMRINSDGNADLDNPSLIKHQNIIFKVNMVCEGNSEKAIIIKEFRQININIKKGEITGIIVVEDNGCEYYSFIRFPAENFLQNIKGSSNSYGWYKNVFCSEIYFEQ